MTTQSAPAVQSPRAKATSAGPVGFVFAIVVGGAPTIVFSWVLSIVIEMVGMQTIWKDQGINHSRDIVIEDLGYIAAAPRSVLIDDTATFSRRLVQLVAQPFVSMGVLQYYERAQQTRSQPVDQSNAVGSALKRAGAASNGFLADTAMVAMYTAQDTALRLAIVLFALPAFVLATVLGVVDGLVRRDLRKWGGGRESSFVYHHAKALTYVAMGGGFSLYLAWPTGGFNPAYMVLVFTVLSAYFLSLTVSSFKKYL
jgi:integrating conjugative element membrane protein (TIGR03747 family)